MDLKKQLGVDTYLWTENFSKNDLWIFDKVKTMDCEWLDIAIGNPADFPVEETVKKIAETGIKVVTTHTLDASSNFISEDPKIREAGIQRMKDVVDINYAIGSPIVGGVIYAEWGYRSGKPRTEREWQLSVDCMKEVAKYAKSKGDLVIAVECVNRFETHILNIAADAVQYCKDVGYDNVKVHLDCFHMIREEDSFEKAVKTCGKEYLGYVHVCESQRGIPGTALVPWKEFFQAIKDIGYTGPMCIESFDPSFEVTNRLCSIWRSFAPSGEALAIQGLANLKKIIDEM